MKAGIYQQETQMRAAYERAGLSVDALYWRMAVELTSDADYTVTLPRSGDSPGRSGRR